MKERFQAIEVKSEKLKQYLAEKRPEVKNFLDNFEMAWVHHDCALEGEVYSPQELTAALYPDARVAEASLLPIVWQIRNHKTAVDFIREESRTAKRNAPITMTFLKKLHDMLAGNTPAALAARAVVARRERTEKEISKEKVKHGFRKDIPLHKTYLHDIAQPSKVQPLLEKLLSWTTSTEFRELHPILQAGRVQHQFIQIFPFVETSGKVGRLLSNYVLMRNGFFPVVIVSVDRAKYFESFRSSFATFSNLIVDAMDNSLENGMKYFRELTRFYH